METFWIIFFKVFSLFLSIAMGFIAGRILKVSRDHIAILIFYLIAPVVFFCSITRTVIDAQTLSLPIIVYFIACLISISFYAIGKLIWQDATKNILALSAGNANAGYFGIPLALFLFDDVMAGVYIVAIIGIVLFENTLGFFITAASSNGSKDGLARVLKLPMLHAFFLGCILNKLGFTMPGALDDFVNSVRGCYTVLGMMLVGMGIASIENLSFDYKFISLALLAKFVIWPLAVLLLIFLDQQLFHLYDHQIYRVLKLLSIVPLAANTVAIASILNANPEKAASAILCGMILVLVYVPVMIIYFVGN